MLLPKCHITITQNTSGRDKVIEFDYLVDADSDHNIETLTDTGTIKLPRKLTWGGTPIALGDSSVDGKALFKRGDKITVQLGIGNSLKTRFIGFIKSIKSGVPVTLNCEDSMFLLKKNPVTHNFIGASVKIEDVLKVILPTGMEYVCADLTIGDLKINASTPAKILEDLKSQGIYSYFRNITENGVTRSVLYSGLAYWPEKREKATFKFGTNEPVKGFGLIIKDDLEYVLAEDVSLKVKATAIAADNSRINVEVGDDDGEVRSVFKYKVSKADLTIFANSELERFKYTGYRGSFTTFGEPAMEKGDIAVIEGGKYNPDGSYLIRQVKVSSGITGYKQIIYLDQILTQVK
jgi:hypothetical protein